MKQIHITLIVVDLYLKLVGEKAEPHLKLF